MGQRPEESPQPLADISQGSPCCRACASRTSRQASARTLTFSRSTGSPRRLERYVGISGPNVVKTLTMHRVCLSIAMPVRLLVRTGLSLMRGAWARCDAGNGRRNGRGAVHEPARR
jgi:hypothetical protein